MAALNGFFSFGTDLWDPSHRFETSWLLSPLQLFFCRALIGLYALTTRLFILGYTCTHPDEGGCLASRQSFSYFTNLCYWGLAFYHLTAAAHTLSYALTSRPLLDRFPRPLQALHSLYYTTVVTFPFLVTIVYWGVIYTGPWFAHEFDAWSNISQHGLNSAFALFEILVPRTNTPPWAHPVWLVVLLGGYLGVAYITLATQGFYVYNFLDPVKDGGRGYVAAYIVGIAVGIVIVFCIVWCAIWLRRWVTETKLGRDGKFAHQHTRAPDAEMVTFEQHQATTKPSGEI